MYRDKQSQSKDAAEVLPVHRRVSAEQPEKRRLFLPNLVGLYGGGESDGSQYRLSPTTNTRIDACTVTYKANLRRGF